MNKASKILTIFLVFASVAFAGFSAVSFLARSDLKSKAAVFPDKIAAQQKILEEIEPEIVRFEARLKEAQIAIKLDLEGIKRRETALEAELKKLQADSREISAKITAEVKKAQQVRDVAKARREDSIRLSSELGILQTQLHAAMAERQRLKDLLRQAEGTLERAERRKLLLEADGATLASAGDGSRPGLEPGTDSDGTAEPLQPMPLKNSPAAKKTETDAESEEAAPRPAAEDKPDSDTPEPEKPAAEKPEPDGDDPGKPDDAAPAEPEKKPAAEAEADAETDVEEVKSE